MVPSATSRAIRALCDPEQVKVLAAGHRPDQHVQVVQFLRVAGGQRPGQEVGLLLGVALKRHLVARMDDGLQYLPERLLPDHLAIRVRARPGQALTLGRPPLAPDAITGRCPRRHHASPRPPQW